MPSCRRTWSMGTFSMRTRRRGESLADEKKTLPTGNAVKRWLSGSATHRWTTTVGRTQRHVRLSILHHDHVRWTLTRGAARALQCRSGIVGAERWGAHLTAAAALIAAHLTQETIEIHLRCGWWALCRDFTMNTHAWWSALNDHWPRWGWLTDRSRQAFVENGSLPWWNRKPSFDNDISWFGRHRSLLLDDDLTGVVWEQQEWFYW